MKFSRVLGELGGQQGSQLYPPLANKIAFPPMKNSLPSNTKLLPSRCGLVRGPGRLRLLQGSCGPFGPKVEKQCLKMVPGASAPGSKKSKKSQKESKKSKMCHDFGLFFDSFFFSVPGPRSPRNPFSDFVDFGPDGPK